jgi:hypothetical protein
MQSNNKSTLLKTFNLSRMLSLSTWEWRSGKREEKNKAKKRAMMKQARRRKKRLKRNMTK